MEHAGQQFELMSKAPRTVPPRWVDSLLGQTFFKPCSRHASLKKNECNNFCVTCVTDGLCQHCLPAHSQHQRVQIRRYVYHDVVKLDDVEPLLLCEGVQSYNINNARVAFLNQRPQLRPAHTPNQACEVCSRGLQDNNRFCSVACKVEALARAGKPFVPSSAPAIAHSNNIKANASTIGRNNSGPSPTHSGTSSGVGGPNTPPASASNNHGAYTGRTAKRKAAAVSSASTEVSSDEEQSYSRQRLRKDPSPVRAPVC